MGKNISFLFLCFCLLMYGNISNSFGSETNNCEPYSNEYNNYIELNEYNTNYSSIISEINKYISIFTTNNCSSELSEATCKKLEFTFLKELSESSCANATINNLENILKCRQFTDASYKKYLPEYEKNNCSIEYKCSLFLNEFNILTNNYYLLCKQNTNGSATNNNAKNVLINCSEAVFDLEQFYLKVKNYSCKYKVINSDGTIVDKNIAEETLEIIKKYNEYMNDLINTGNGGIKSNGIARGLCYAINIVSGPFGKAVASLFIILLGMSFLSGHGEAFSFKSLISIVFALALIFGSGQLANLISRNVYSCEHIIIDN